MRRLMRWINVPDDLINKISLQVMQENEGIEVQRRLVEIPSFNEVPLPDDAVRIDSVEHVTKHLVQVVEYMKARDLYLEDYPFYWSPSLGYRDRLIVPFYYEGKVVGWTARTVQPDKQPKYLSEQQPGYVFNLDEQRPQKIFVIVCEGPVDAIHVDGVALMGSEIKDQQALLINRLNREVIVVPDRDEAGSKLIERAIDLGWSVSLPKWADGIKDISDAVKQYGKLYTLHSIVGAVESSPLKIRLGAKKWFG